MKLPAVSACPESVLAASDANFDETTSPIGNNNLPLGASHPRNAARIVLDHARRVMASRAGFHFHGIRWLPPWLAYALSPVAARLVPNHLATFDKFNARLGQGDLYTFANVFTDYPMEQLAECVADDIDLVIDAGANVGAFSFWLQLLCHQFGRKIEFIAVEPDPENAAFLRSQPFAETMDVREAAVGPGDGTGYLNRGHNSVTHRVDFSAKIRAPQVKLLSLLTLCSRPCLVKMDIEGGELEILQGGLPATVKHLVLEWHHAGEPGSVLAGDWTQLSTDLYGASTWFLRR